MGCSVHDSALELHIANEFLTDFGIARAMESACAISGCDGFDAGNHRLMSVLETLCWNDLLIECPRWAKRMHNPVLDFSALNAACAQRAREYAARHVASSTDAE